MQSAEMTTDQESGDTLETILIDLQPGHWSGHSGERVSAKRLGDGIYEIRNTPWYAYDLNWGDVVRCEGMSTADLPIVADVVGHGGHRTIRVFFEEAEDEERRAHSMRSTASGPRMRTPMTSCTRSISSRTKSSRRSWTT
jgi:hypothetical protein